MQELELQKALRRGMTREDLREQYGIKSSQHPEFPELWLYKYDQIESPMGERIVQEARGIILGDNHDIVSYGFNKFFNHGEGHAAKIDWSTARVYEKLDGSLVTMYHYKGNWHVATSGHPSAGGEVGDFGFTFAELFWRVFHTLYDITWFDENANYMFELMTPYNKIVVNHKEEKLVLIGARERSTGQEIEPNFKDLDCVRSFPLQSLDQCLTTFDEMDPSKQEGYVICDANFNRIKVKHPGYVALHHIKGAFSMRNLCKLVKTGEMEEFDAHFPEYAEESKLLKGKYAELIEKTEQVFDEIKGIEGQKDFALQATKHLFSGALFTMRKLGTTAREFYKNMGEDKLLRLMEVKDDQPTE